MALQLDDLDDRTRGFMLDELERDVASGSLYISPHLSERGQRDYEPLLRAAIRNGNDASFADELGSFGRMNLTRQWKTSRGSVTTADLPAAAPRTLAENEFHRFYARGLCRRALEDGIRTLAIYRARAATPARANSDAMIGTRIDASSLLEDLRTAEGATPPHGLPPCPDSGLSVRIR